MRVLIFENDKLESGEETDYIEIEGTGENQLSVGITNFNTSFNQVDNKFQCYIDLSHREARQLAAAIFAATDEPELIPVDDEVKKVNVTYDIDVSEYLRKLDDITRATEEFDKKCKASGIYSNVIVNASYNEGGASPFPDVLPEYEGHVDPNRETGNENDSVIEGISPVQEIDRDTSLDPDPLENVKDEEPYPTNG